MNIGNPKRLVFVTLLFASFLLPQTTVARIYKWIDNEGNVQYTQTPPSNRPAETFKTRPEPINTQKAREKLDAERERSKLRQEERQKQKEEKRATKQEAKEKKERCERARTQLDGLESTPRVFKKDEEGNRVRLKEEERQEEIAKTKDRITENCGR